LTGQNTRKRTLEFAVSDPRRIQTRDLSMQKTQNHYQRSSIVGTPASYSLAPYTTEIPGYFALWLKQCLILPDIKFIVQKITTGVVQLSPKKKLFSYKTECQMSYVNKQKCVHCKCDISPCNELCRELGNR
jgi:hypothetical protein